MTARVEEQSNVGHNTVTGDYSSTTLTKAKQNEHNTSESEPNVKHFVKAPHEIRLNPSMRDLLGRCSAQ